MKTLKESLVEAISSRTINEAKTILGEFESKLKSNPKEASDWFDEICNKLYIYRASKLKEIFGCELRGSAKVFNEVLTEIVAWCQSIVEFAVDYEDDLDEVESAMDSLKNVCKGDWGGMESNYDTYASILYENDYVRQLVDDNLTPENWNKYCKAATRMDWM